MRIYLRYAFINNSQRQKISFRPSFQKKIQMLGVLFFLWMRTFITTSSSIKNLQHKYASGTDQLVTGKGPSKALLCEGTVLKLCGTTCRAPFLVTFCFQSLSEQEAPEICSIDSPRPQMLSAKPASSQPQYIVEPSGILLCNKGRTSRMACASISRQLQEIKGALPGPGDLWHLLAQILHHVHQSSAKSGVRLAFITTLRKCCLTS